VTEKEQCVIWPVSFKEMESWQTESQCQLLEWKTAVLTQFLDLTQLINQSHLEEGSCDATTSIPKGSLWPFTRVTMGSDVATRSELALISEDPNAHLAPA
jgi:hypothetical protein